MKSSQSVDYQIERISNFCYGMVHIGKAIEQKARERKIKAPELAKLVNTTKQNIYQIFKKKSIDTEQLKMISEALNFNFFELFNEDLKNIVQEPAVAYGEKERIRQVSTKAISLQGQQVIIVKTIGKHQIGQLFSLEDDNYEDKENCIVKYIDVLPQFYLRNEEKKKEYKELAAVNKESVFRLKYCEQIPVREISDIQYLDDPLQEIGLINKN